MVNKVYLWVVGLIALITICILPQLKPSKLEFANIYFLDKSYEKSMNLYTELWDSGNHGVNVLVPLIQLNIQEGNIEQAVILMERYVEIHPGSLQARDKMTDLYKQAYLPERYQSSLESSQKLLPTSNKARELSQIYNYNSEYSKQKEILQKIIDSKSSIEKDYYDLAYLYAKNGDYNQAIDVMYQLIQEKKKPTPEAIQLTMTLLFDADRSDEALKLAQSYAKDDIQPNVKIAAYLQSIGAANIAYQLLEPLAEKHIKDPVFLERWMEINYSIGNKQYVYDYLMQLYNTDELPRNVEYILLQLSPEFATRETISKIISKVDLENVPHERLIMTIEGLLRLNDPQLIERLKNKLPEYIVDTSPLIKLLLSVPSAQADENGNLVYSVDTSILSPTQKLLLAKVFLERKQPQIALTIVKSLTSDELYEVNKLDYATILIGLNHPEIGIEKFKNPEDLQEVMALTLLYSPNSENNSKVMRIVDNNSQRIRPLLPYLQNLYFVASDYNNNELALELAMKMYDINPNTKNTEYLANAYMLNKNITQAIPYYKSLADSDFSHQEMYLYALSELNHSSEIMTDQHKLELQNLAKNMLSSPDLNPQKRAEISSTLLENGYKEIAETQFKLLALEKDPDSTEVQQLLYIWGPTLTEKQIDWIKQRAINDKKDPNEWLLLLNNLGLSSVSIELVDQYPDHFNVGKTNNAYLQALVQQEQKDEIANTINNMDLDSLSTEELEKLTLTLAGTKDDTLKLKLYKLILKKQPENALALKALARYYYQSGLFYDASITYQKLDKISKLQPQDIFNYAESLRNTYRRAQSKPIYERFLKLADMNTNYEILSNQERSQLAIAFSITNNFNKANKLYKMILESEPNNETYKISYAHFLIDNNRFDQAEKILNTINKD
ncbi:tetratricopeptide repeat protein [Francisellaceae bacterium]|nr:tetratricopeptide repeat protein [Francisellaceae bacterium]